MIHLPETFWYLPLLLYAETHYKFRYFFSFLRKNEPEIIADAPHRIEPGNTLPLLILAKDANRYPCGLMQLQVTITQGAKHLINKRLLPNARTLQDYFWWEVFHLDVSQWKGWIELRVSITIEVNGKIKTYDTDNHKTSSHKPLRVFLSNDQLPHFANLHLGDAHTHSNYTDDQVEFGSPLKASQELCKAMGLSFFCVTDHSYDLDDRVDNYLVNDPAIPKWNSLQAEIDELNKHQKGFAIVRGEEITCRNGNEKNIHMLLYGTTKFFPGSGDSAEKWLRTTSEHSLGEILKTQEETSIAYAAHPKERVPPLQRLLLGRGEWLDTDIEAEGLSGIQIANGTIDEGFSKGYRVWIQSLLGGKKLFILGGNDAHGNFNRFRQIGIPFVSLRERDVQLFGKIRTGIFTDKPLSEQVILQAFKQGDTIVTDGPVIRMTIADEKGTKISIGGAHRGKAFEISITAQSSQEFGAIESLKILIGKIGSEEEKMILEIHNEQEYSLDQTVPILIEANSYVRAELHTSSSRTFDNNSHWCLTNPIWLRP